MCYRAVAATEDGSVEAEKKTRKSTYPMMATRIPPTRCLRRLVMKVVMVIRRCRLLMVVMVVVMFGRLNEEERVSTGGERAASERTGSSCFS